MEKTPEMKKRVLVIAALAASAFAYILVCEFTSVRIPCVFHELTGLDCPGCGVTRMCMHIVHLDIAGAFADNGMALVTSPLIVYLAGCMAAGYLGVRIPENVKNVNTRIAAVLCAAFIVFGIARNIM